MQIEASIIIPVKDENDSHVSQCLESLEKLDFSKPFEILVIKGGNRAQSRNFGIDLAKGEIVVFIDSDCVATKDWLSLLVGGLRNEGTLGGIGGSNLSPVDGAILGKAIDFVFSSHLGSLGSASLHGPSEPKFVSALACINSAFWHSIIEEIKGFDEEFELCEDTNLSYKVRAAGFKLLFDPKIIVWHNRRDSIKSFASQFFLYGIGRMRSILTSREYASEKIVIPFVGVLVFPLIAWRFPLLAIAIFATYLAAIFFKGFQATRKTKKGRLMLLIPELFIVEHLSYFLGMIYGIAKGKWKKEKRSCEVFYHAIIAK